MQVVRAFLVERFPDHDPMDQRALRILRTVHDRGYAACRNRGKHRPQNEFLGAGRMNHDRRHQCDPIRRRRAESRAERGSYLVPPAPRITGVPYRHTTPQREEGKRKTETRDPRSSLSVKRDRFKHLYPDRGPGRCRRHRTPLHRLGCAWARVSREAHPVGAGLAHGLVCA